MSTLQGLKSTKPIENLVQISHKQKPESETKNRIETPQVYNFVGI